MSNSPCLKQLVISAVRGIAQPINSGNKGAVDISALVEATSQLPLSNLDDWERLIRLEFSSALRNSALPKWKFWLQPSQVSAWLDLIDFDGYKREQALNIVEVAPNGFFFALALRRLNDWVPQVRKAARENIHRIAKSSETADIVDALCAMLAHWESWGRMGELEKQALLEFLSYKEVVDALKSTLISSSSGPMASLFSQLGRTPFFDEYIGEIAENAIQPSVRAKAYRSQFEGRMTWTEGRKRDWIDIRYCKSRLIPIISERKLAITFPFAETMEKASIDRSSVVRRVAAEYLIRENMISTDERLRLAQQFALDKSVAVSTRGQFVLKQLDFVESIESNKT